jgi:hypothetical protein
VVISEFSNGTTDPVFEGTLRQALTIQIEQSPFLKIMDRRTNAAGPSADGPLSPQR